jgi:hypothetical protein
MPAALEIAIFTFGAALVMMSLVKKPFQIFSYTIPAAGGRYQRVIAAVMGTVLLVVAIIVYVRKPVPSPALVAACGKIPYQPKTPDPFHACPAEWSDAKREYDTYLVDLSVYATCVKDASQSTVADRSILGAVTSEMNAADKHWRQMEDAHTASARLGLLHSCNTSESKAP